MATKTNTQPKRVAEAKAENKAVDEITARKFEETTEQGAERVADEVIAEAAEVAEADREAEEAAAVAEEKAEQVADVAWIDEAIAVAKKTAPGGPLFVRNERSKPTRAGAAKLSETLCNRLRAEFPDGVSRDQFVAAVESAMPAFKQAGNKAPLGEFMKFLTTAIAGGRGEFMVELKTAPAEATVSDEEAEADAA